MCGTELGSTIQLSKLDGTGLAYRTEPVTRTFPAVQGKEFMGKQGVYYFLPCHKVIPLLPPLLVI